MRPGISISISFGAEYRERNERWIFVRDRDIARSDIGRHYVNRTNNTTIINSSTVIVNSRRDEKRNATFVTGPNRDDVQRVTHTPIKSVIIRENNKPGQHQENGEMQIYRPHVQKNGSNAQNPAPSKVTRLNDVRPAGTRQREVSPAANERKDQQPETRAVIPSNNRGRERQPQNPAPPVRDQSSPPREVNPTNARGAEKQRPSVAPAVQPSQQRNIDRSNIKGRDRQPQNVAPHIKAQPQQRNVNPPNPRGKDKQPQSAAPRERIQPPRNVNPPDSKGKEKPQQSADQSNKNSSARLSQPKTNQDEDQSGFIKKKASTILTRAILTIYYGKLLNQPKR